MTPWNFQEYKNQNNNIEDKKKDNQNPKKIIMQPLELPAVCQLWWVQSTELLCLQSLPALYTLTQDAKEGGSLKRTRGWKFSWNWAAPEATRCASEAHFYDIHVITMLAVASQRPGLCDSHCLKKELSPKPGRDRKISDSVLLLLFLALHCHCIPSLLSNRLNQIAALVSLLWHTAHVPQVQFCL